MSRAPALGGRQGYDGPRIFQEPYTTSWGTVLRAIYNKDKGKALPVQIARGVTPTTHHVSPHLHRTYLPCHRLIIAVIDRSQVSRRRADPRQTLQIESVRCIYTSLPLFVVFRSVPSAPPPPVVVCDTAVPSSLCILSASFFFSAFFVFLHVISSSVSLPCPPSCYIIYYFRHSSPLFPPALMIQQQQSWYHTAQGTDYCCRYLSVFSSFP